MATLDEVFNAEELVKYADTLMKDDNPALWESLFPSEIAPSLELKWIKGSKEQIVTLRPSELDEMAARRNAVGAQSITTEMPFFREAAVIDEKQRQHLTMLIASYTSRDYIDAALANLYDHHAGLILGAYGMCDVMAGALITSGQILASAPDDSGRDVRYSYNYDDANGSWAANNITQLTGAAQWTAANKATSNPVDDMLKVIEDMAERGYNIARILMNTTTFRAYYGSESVSKALQPLGGLVRKASAKGLLEDETEANLMIYDRVLKDANGNDIKVIPDHHVVLLPDGPLGKMYFGPTPEAFDLRMKKSIPAKDIAISGQGVSVLTYTEDHPIRHNTVVSMAALPSFTAMDGVAVIRTKVAA